MDVEEVKKALGEFADDFNFAIEGVFIVARAKSFINNKEAWSEIVRRMNTVNAEWIKLGKQSHFRVPVTHAVEQNILGRLEKSIDVLQICLRDLNEVKKALKEK